jgi:hypothetical protein
MSRDSATRTGGSSLVCTLNGARVLSSIAAAWRRPDRDRRARPVCAGWCRRAHSAALPRWRANAQLADGDWHAVRACAEPMPTRRTWRRLRWKGCCAVWADGLDALRSIGVHAWEVTMVGRQPVHGRAAAGAGHPRRTGRSARSGRIRGQRSGPAGRLGAGGRGAPGVVDAGRAGGRARRRRSRSQGARSTAGTGPRSLACRAGPAARPVGRPREPQVPDRTTRRHPWHPRRPPRRWPRRLARHCPPPAAFRCHPADHARPSSPPPVRCRRLLE